ncbi:MAG: hypothetical protein ACI9JR_000659 [Gammaproteobacteria bacterium]|jgi:hypothetical protein
MDKKLVLLEKLMRQLNDEQRQSVVDYAGFLAQQLNRRENESPRLIPRPVQESVASAIKRLKRTYFMLDTDELLNDVATLMSKHLLQGLAVSVVIDELQLCFQSYYEQYLNND